ncbi:MAG: xanthine dehydrogenase family protein molybdopterin-binding subunit [Candidatus Dormibacterales bacterium]
METQIGRPVRRLEDPDLIAGRGRYASDITLPGLVHIAIRRADVPRAGGLLVDLDPALAMPGVLGAWKSGQLGLAEEDMPDPGDAPPRRPVVAGDEVRYEGEAVAVVAAETEYQARDAADAVEVRAEPSPLDAEEAGRQQVAYGDASAAFEGAPVVVRERLAMARICGAAMEPRAVLAEWRPDEGRLFVRASVGWVHGLRDVLAACLGLEPSRVVALAEDVGGSFGAKNHPYPEYVIAAAVSRLLSRPVRWVASRSDDGNTTAQSHSADLDLEIAAEEDGRLRGFRARVDWTIGAYATRGIFQNRSISTHMMSAYRLPALQVELINRYSDTPPASFIRGGGRPVGNYAIERMLDRLARRLGLDPFELRRRNLVPPDEMPFQTGLENIVYDGGDYPRLLARAREAIGLEEIRRRQAAGEPVGVGVAMCVESTGIGMAEPSRVVVRPDGTAHVYVGTTPQGQGHRTFATQVAADRLGWPPDRIVVHAGDSRDVGFAAVTAGSRSAVEMGNSVSLSAKAARRRLLERASELLEAAPEDLVVGVEGATVRGVPGRAVPLPEILGEGLEAAETWNSEGASTWASSCHAAAVRVDVETGSVEMTGYVIAHDSGRVINPVTLEGQLHGGYAHGFGYALFEEALYSEDGVFQSPSFLDYTIVSAPEMACEPQLIHTETATGHNPEGFRGVGEAGTIAVPAAIANAVEDALLATGRDALVDRVPITPERLWRLLAEKGAPAR